MSYRDAMYEIEVLANRIGFGIKNLGALQTALAEGILCADESSEAIYCVFDYLYDIHDQLQTLINRTIEANRRGI